MNRLLKWLAVVALVVSLGGHWAVLQGVAWTTMLARFAQSMPLAQAVIFTFDGKHPCQLCLAVQEGQQAEQKESKLKTPERLLLFLDLHLVALPSPPPPAQPAQGLDKVRSRLDRPPHPPPRGV